MNKRSLRDRLTLLQAKFKAKTRDEEKASGISPVQREVDTLLEEIYAKEEARCAKSVSNRNKAVQDKASAQDIRQKAMESMGETLKRKQNNGVNSSKRRKSTHDALGVLQEKAKLDMSLRREELELRKREEAKSTLLAEQQNQMQQEMLKLIQQQQQEQQKQQQQQQHQQQQQFQAMQAMFQQQQQILTLFEKFASK